MSPNSRSPIQFTPPGGRSQMPRLNPTTFHTGTTPRSGTSRRPINPLSDNPLYRDFVEPPRLQRYTQRDIPSVVTQDNEWIDRDSDEDSETPTVVLERSNSETDV